jgi:hypothetical protein
MLAAHLQPLDFIARLQGVVSLAPQVTEVVAVVGVVGVVRE